MLSVSVVIPVRDDEATLDQAVAGVLAQIGVEIEEVVIAVGQSDDGTDELAHRLAVNHQQVRVVQNPSGRTPAGLNLAIAATSGDVVVRVDARSKLPADYVCNALETMRRTGAANVGAIQNPVGETPSQRGIAAAMRSSLGTGGAAYRGAEVCQHVDTAYLGVFRRAALIEVGGFDEGFVRNQDAELNARLNAAGHEVWLDPRMVVDYLPRRRLRDLARQYWQYGWWRYRTVRRHRRSVRFRQLAPPAIVVVLVASIVVGALITPLALLVPAVYLGAVVVSALASAGSALERLVHAAALVVMHLSWGSGFLASALRGRAGTTVQDASTKNG